MSTNKILPTTRRHHKRNFSEIVNTLIPKYYVLEDAQEYGEVVDSFDDVINEQIKLAASLASVIELPQGNFFSSLNQFNNIKTFFDKRNEYSYIDKEEFEKSILYDLNVSFKDFSSSGQFDSYVRSTLIPTLRESWNTPSAVDNYLSLFGWFYILSTSSIISSPIQPSSLVADLLVKNLFYEKELTIADGINALTEFVWRNELPFIPEKFVSGNTVYTSGTQQLDKLKTINNILYSITYLDKFDTYVLDSFEYFDQLQDYKQEIISNGAFWRLVRAFSFAFADQQNEANQLQVLYDLQECPDDLLPELAYLIGWKLVGYDKSKWRLQLANAVSIYRKTGTKQSIQAVLNSSFSEGGIDLISKIEELWESYLPFLVYYALATDSHVFKDFNTYTEETAYNLGIEVYDNKNFDNNIRLAVDKVLLVLFNKYPTLFRMGGKSFPLNSEDFRFNYRGRDYPIPPFEEMPYYINSEINSNFLLDLADTLVCFGVTQELALDLINYVRLNTIADDKYADDTEITTENSWLIFTKSLQLPPNWDKVVNLLEKDKSQYLPLWNGKSSHFSLQFSGGSFNFSKVRYTADSKYAIIQASRLANEFSPAHAIPIVNTYLEGFSTYADTYTEYPYGEFVFNTVNFYNTNRELKGLDILQGDLEFSGLGRERLQSIYSPSALLNSSSLLRGPTLNTANIINNERNSLRRRNYQGALNTAGYYDRSGFNQPVFRIGKILEYPSGNRGAETDASSVIKGIIPSSLEFKSTDADCDSLLPSSLHPIYKFCSPLHKTPMFGYYLSSTLKPRGSIPFNSDYQGSALYEDRGQLDPFMYVIYKIEQKKLEGDVLDTIYKDPADYSRNSYWLNISGSEVNRKMSCSETVLSSLEGYYNYSFGRSLQKLYNEYKTIFNYHPLTGNKYSENTRDILRHCFGSILENSDFEDRGLYGNTFYVSSSNETKNLTLRSLPFGPETYPTYGTNVNIQSSDFLVARSETRPRTADLVNSEIIKGIDIVHTSGMSHSNAFTVYDYVTFFTDSYIKNNCMIKMRSLDGLPRLRFHVSGTPDNCNPSDPCYGSFRENNFLSPNHKFKVYLKGLAALNDGSQLTNAKVGVWIHTKSTNGASFHFTKDNKWIKYDQSEVTIPTILRDLTHVVEFDVDGITKSDNIDPVSGGQARVFRCLKPLDPEREDPDPFNDTTILFDKQFFSEKSVEFNTFINCGTTDTSALHNISQHYIVEVFMLPDRVNNQQFVLLDSISLRDETLWNYTRIERGGSLLPPLYTRRCDPILLDLSEEDVRILLKYFSEFGGKGRTESFLSRDKTKTQNIHGVDGGSRLSYRFHPSWYSNEKDNLTNQYTLIDFNDLTDEDNVENDFFPRGSGGDIPEIISAVSAIETGTYPIDPDSPEGINNLDFGFWFG